MDLRAEPLVLSVPAVEKNRYYSVMLNDGNTFNYGYIGSRATGSDAGDYLVVGPNWKGETPAGIKKVFHSTTDFSLAAFRTQLIDAKDMPNVEEGAGRLQDSAAVGVSSSSRRRPPPAVDWPKFDKDLVKTEFFDYLDFRAAVRAGRPRGRSDPRQARQHRYRPGQEVRLQGSLARAQGRHPARHEGRRQEGRRESRSLGKTINGWKVSSAVRRPRLLQRRLAAARSRRHGPASTATTPSRPCIPSPRRWRTAKCSTAASTSTR
jgi:hypothetical protein